MHRQRRGDTMATAHEIREAVTFARDFK